MSMPRHEVQQSFLLASNVDGVIAHKIVHSSPWAYDCGTEVSPSIVPVMSKGTLLTKDGPLSPHCVEVVLADVGYRMSPSLLA